MSPAPRPGLLPVAALVALLILVLAATGLFCLRYTDVQAARDRAAHEKANETLLLTLRTRAAFKTQVQEWKNILLRGRDPKDLETYRTRFLEAEKLVGSSLETLARTAASTGAISTGSGSHAPSALIAGHQELSNAYQAALATADFSDPGTPFRIDAAIRGIDRPLSDKLDALAADMERHELASLQAMGTAASARYETLRRATWIVAGLAVLASLWLCFRASRLAPA